MKKVFFILIGVVVFITTSCLSFSVSLKKSLAEIQNEDIDLEKVADGVYNGHSEMGPVVVDVKVYVENNRIVKVSLVRHECGLGHPADILVDRIVDENTWNVDSVSGATVSSEIIKNAVNIALRNNK